MVDPINLGKARKAKARSEAKLKAAENRVRFGRSKAQTTVSELEAERARRLLDQKKRED